MEETPCEPVTEYVITKFKVEAAVNNAARGFFDAVILRLTSVFGPEGEALKNLPVILWLEAVFAIIFNPASLAGER